MSINSDRIRAGSLSLPIVIGTGEVLQL